MKIGNWLIDQDGISWDGEIDYYIPLARITETGFGERKNTYDWLVQLSTKTWISQDDINALNVAFIYVLGSNKIILDYNIFQETVRLQKEEIADR